jgi:thiamine-monophosphate kinase
MIPPVSGEDDLIARYFAPLAGAGGLGLRDDAALLGVAHGEELVLTKDMLVAGIHFFADDPPGSIARKALRVNLSDLAAKAANPRGFLLGLGLPKTFPGTAQADWLAAFAKALGEDAADYGCPLLGGDTVASPERLTLSVTALGTVPTGQMLPRTGARAGDMIFVSGTIGDAALGLQARLRPDAIWFASLTAAHQAHLLDRYLHPQPRNALTPALRQFAHAGMDVSDGLVGDLAKMMRVSGVSAVVDLDLVPLSPAARSAMAADDRLAETAFTGGDDYEVLCTVPPSSETEFREAARLAGVEVTHIGHVTAGVGGAVFTRHKQAVVYARGAFSHV